MRSTMQSAPLTVRAILEHGVTIFGDSTVTTATATGSRTVTYQQIGERAAQLAHVLRRLGVEGDQRVATFMWNNQEHLEAYLAIPSMGAVLHTLNIRLFPEQLEYIANHAEDQVVIVDASLLPVLAKILPTMTTVHTVLVVGGDSDGQLAGSGKTVLDYDEALVEEPVAFVWADVAEDDAAAMCFTSGTTGNPKGVVYSHRSTWLHSLSASTANTFGIGMLDKVLPVVPMFHVNAWGLPYAAFFAGADILMPDRFLQAEPLARLIETEKPTFSAGVPTIWSDLLRYVDTHTTDLSSLRTVAIGGSAVPRSLIEAFERNHGVLIRQAWGMTETSPIAAVAYPPKGVEGEAAMKLRATQGRPVAGVQARIVGDDGRDIAWDGVSAGELEVRGPWITSSYYRAEDSDRFHDGWLRTGDVGHIDPQGHIELTDRSKDVIKSGGEWISSVELETTLMGHPDVVEAAVVGVPDERWAERPLAAVVLKEGAQPEPAALRAWLSGHVASWQTPERWTFIDAVPKTSVGKFDKKVLRRQYADGELVVITLPGPGQ